jgi:chromosome segregation ATPase
MQKNIKLLEERVIQAVGRLRELSAERKELKEELESLREQLEGIEAGGSADIDNREELWRSQKEEAISVIRQTLAELRGE